MVGWSIVDADLLALPLWRVPFCVIDVETTGTDAGADRITELGAIRVDRAELGYWLAPALWGQGYVTEAARALVQYGFDIVGLHKVTVGCVERNVGSRRVIEKIGFALVGRAIDDVWRDGRWETLLRYELLARDYSDITTTRPIARIQVP